MFSNTILDPSEELKELVSPTIFHKVRSSHIIKSRRKRQCYRCLEKINNSSEYVNHQYKYDNSIKTISFHIKCFNNKWVKIN